MTTISVVMPCHNRAYDLLKTLQAYDRQVGDEPFEMIAVDDGSSDETYQVLSAYRPQRYSLRVIRMETNRGPAAARNHGMALADAPLILFVGDDILPDAYLLRGHLAEHRRHPQLGVAILGHVQWAPDLPVNTLMAHIDGPGTQQFSYHYFKDGAEYDFRHLYTANISLKRDFLNSVDKGFDTDFPYAAFEDVEFSYRLSKRGLKIIYSAKLVGYHYHYHNIWTFSTRQYRTGLMACLLVKKHPEIKTRIMGREWPYWQFRWRLAAPFWKTPMENAEHLEEECLHKLSAYEWEPRLNLDKLYLPALKYFFYKGLIHGTFGDGPVGSKILDRYAKRMLVPLLS